MAQTVEVIFDGLVFRPLEPLDIAPYTQLQITLSIEDSELTDPAESLSVEETDNADETENLNQYISEHYIYSDFYHSGK
jgi:predicted DNA-binding antitoxin AbrB/MazE fold protein